MPHTTIQEKLTRILEEHRVTAPYNTVEGLLVRLVEESCDEAEAEQYLCGLLQHLRGEINVSVYQGEVIFRAPYDG